MKPIHKRDWANGGRPVGYPGTGGDAPVMMPMPGMRSPYPAKPDLNMHTDPQAAR